MELLVFLLIAFVVVTAESYIYTRNATRNIEYKCYFETSEVYEGDEAILIEEMTNGKFLPIPWMKSEITTSSWLEFAELQSGVSGDTRFVSSFFMLKSYHKIIRRWKVKCVKRGIFRIEKTVLVATDLFGTVNASIPVEINSEICVLPRAFDIDDIIPSSCQLYGDYVVKRQPASDPFYYNGIREYADGDDSKKINWLATAKQNEIMVFRNEFTSSRRIAVIMNIQSKHYDVDNISNRQAVETCIKFCATIINQCSENNIPISFMCNTYLSDDSPAISAEGVGEEHTLELLRLLSALECKDAVNFDLFLSENADRCKATDIYVITSYISNTVSEYIEEHTNIKAFSLGVNYSGKVTNIYELLREQGETV